MESETEEENVVVSNNSCVAVISDCLTTSYLRDAAAYMTQERQFAFGLLKLRNYMCAACDFPTYLLYSKAVSQKAGA